MWTLLTVTAAALLAAGHAGIIDDPECEYKEFRCENGACVDRMSWCDGVPDCPDDSDELYCRMADPSIYKPAMENVNGCDESRYFQCQNAMCIPKSGRCNDMPDCQDGEDEENCDYLYETSDDTNSESTTPLMAIPTSTGTPTTTDSTTMEAPTTPTSTSTEAPTTPTSIDLTTTEAPSTSPLTSTEALSTSTTTEASTILTSTDSTTTKVPSTTTSTDTTTTIAPATSTLATTTSRYTITTPPPETDTTPIQKLLPRISATPHHPVVKLLPRSDVTSAAPPLILPTSNTMAFSSGKWLPSRFDVLRKSVRHVLDGRDDTWGWGRATPRVAAALALVNATYFGHENYDGMLTRKQLHVQLALDLMKQQERPLRLQDLSHYVQGLVATCGDPRDFHGVDMVKMLRRAVSRRHARSLFVGPSAYLALCNAGQPPLLKRIRNMAYRRHDQPRWLDVQSYALLTISCRCSLPNASEEWRSLKKDVARNISEWQQEDGGFGSVHSTGLALQALISAEEPGTEGAKGRALAHLLLRQDWQGSYGSELDNYFVLPALSGTSLAALHKLPCPQQHHTQATEGAADHHHPPRKGGGNILVHYSLWVGGAANEIQTVTVALPRHSDFLQVMRAAEKINPRFKADVLQTSRSTAVHAIGGRASDVHRSIYWTLFRRVPVPFRPRLANVTATDAKLKLLGAKRWTKDLRKLHPKDGEHLAFWYKPYM